LHGKTITEVKEKINSVLTKLKSQGFITRKLATQDSESMRIPNWMWGHTEGLGMFGRDYFNLTDKERIEILMFHLEEILVSAGNYDNTYSFFRSE